MRRLILCLLLYSFGTRSDAIRCFDCKSVPFPRDCARVTECNKGEHCFTEQIVTASGNVVYNVGCLQKENCAVFTESLLGRRSTIHNKRATDLSTCVECCADSFCNMNGCGASAIPPEQRGPYCYNCDAVLDPTSCEKVAVCLPNEVCLLYSPPEFRGLPETLYQGKCGRQSKCQELSEILNFSKCAVTCCNGDFCNDQCASSQSVSMSTLTPTPSRSTHVASSKTTVATQVYSKSVENTTVKQTTAYNLATTTELKTTKGTTEAPSSSAPPTTKAPIQCRYHGYISIHDSHTQLCIHIVISHLNWTDARSACKREGGDLLVLDTREKALLMRNTITNDKELRIHTIYWIGARDDSNHLNFYWTNNATVDKSRADWGDDEPDSNAPACVTMFRNDSFRWHDRHCNELHSYICERK